MRRYAKEFAYFAKVYQETYGEALDYKQFVKFWTVAKLGYDQQMKEMTQGEKP